LERGGTGECFRGGEGGGKSGSPGDRGEQKYFEAWRRTFPGGLVGLLRRQIADGGPWEGSAKKLREGQRKFGGKLRIGANLCVAA